MSHFEFAIAVVLLHEGGYVDHPADPGGETNFGITKRDFPHLDIRGLTREQAAAIYRDHYWKPIYDKITSPWVAAKVFDMAVNMGGRQAAQLVQRAVGVVADGIFGPVTVAAVNALDEAACLAAIKEQQAGFYRMLANRRQSMQVFLKGWLARAEWPKQGEQGVA